MRRLLYSTGIFLFLFLLSTGFYSSYQVTKLKAQVRQLTEEKKQLTSPTDSETADTGYLLKEEDGCVCVYRRDGKTLYETTSIQVEELPTKLKSEIYDGKILDSELELYSFLENYSS